MESLWLSWRGRFQIPIRVCVTNAPALELLRCECSAASGNVDSLDLAERHLEEASAQLAEGLDLAAAEEAVLAFAVGGAGQAGRLERALGRRRRRRGRR
jgi:hypothetical protein